ncbi:MAG: hypothetical protein CO032_03520 [Nitrosopumilales archaeon CG_4_9_14_0_2_um_filter_34_16]|nr:MAG: hypothetical protein CO032_03520 [Nitrosopumilales archaeon CG_4_9_14_0_2_um_filter_34_16]
MNVVENDRITQHPSFSTNKYLMDIMKQSFEFWHNDSLINYPLVWKKALESDSKIMKKVRMWEKHSTQKTGIIMEEFFEMWAYAIRKSNFEMATRSIQEWERFWRNATDEQFRVCSEVLQMIEKYWREIQNKNIE